MEFPPNIPIEHKGLNLKLLVLDGSSLSQVKHDLHKSTDEAYEFCFKHPSPNTFSQLNNFDTRKGCSIVVFEPETNKTHFVITLIYFPQTSAVEIYNVCKLQHSTLSAREIIGIIIDQFCIDNPLFDSCKYIHLAMLCESIYFFPAFITYCKLGFRVDENRQSLSMRLPDHFTMSRPIINNHPIPPSRPEDEILKINSGCMYTDQHIRLLENSIKNNKKEIKYPTTPSKNKADFDIHQSLLRLRDVMIQHKEKK